MPEKEKLYDDPSNWEYDCGPANFTGDFDKLPPYIQQVANDLTKQAFPDGVEAYQKQQATKKKIILELDHENYPLILRQYGAEGAKAQAISMCLAQGRPVTKENLEGFLTNLEEALEEIFESGVDDPQ
jgi:hypothetical protein